MGLSKSWCPPSSRTQKPEYVSAATAHAALLINGAASAAGSGACSPSGSPPSCTISWSFAGTVPASYPFAVEVDNGANILTENKANFLINAGSNTLSTLTLNGIAANAAVSGIAFASAPEPCSGSSSGTLTIADAALDTITSATTPPAPGFDN